MGHQAEREPNDGNRRTDIEGVRIFEYTPQGVNEDSSILCSGAAHYTVVHLCSLLIEYTAPKKYGVKVNSQVLNDSGMNRRNLCLW